MYDGLVNRRYCLNREIFEFVERRIRECKYKHTKLPPATNGSIVQQVIWSPQTASTSRFVQTVATIGRATSKTRLPLRATIAARVMCTLRRELETGDGDFIHPWACLHYNNYQNVPANWANNRNFLVNKFWDE
ncbi:hypothetical protein RR48_01241 [Papilio machaon]|uniref:Uncharacterized protein n=1 Tax=Papilio machaon TaxID=76193 RepID=A0A0N1PJX2_PAPMA|nr:hypothetical protein RR48_01241 [Papilio machaon]